MLSKEIIGLANSLGELAGNVPEKTWHILDRIRCNLRSLGEQVGQLESHFILRPEKEGRGDDTEA